MIALQGIPLTSSIALSFPFAEQASLEVACRGEDVICEEPGVGLVYDTLLKRIFVVAQPHLHDCRIMVTLTHVNNVSLHVVGLPSDAPTESAMRHQTAVFRAVSNSQACVVAQCIIFVLMCIIFCSSCVFLVLYLYISNGDLNTSS